MKNSINKKLAAAFGLCVLLLAVIVAFNYSALQKLEALHQQTSQRSLSMELAVDAAHIGEYLYAIIGDTVINGVPNTQQDWIAGKRVSLAKMDKVVEIATMPEERALALEAKAALSSLVSLFEQEMQPLLKDENLQWARISEVDAEIDRQREAISLALQWIAKSMSKQNLQADEEFRAVLKEIICFGLAISLAGVAVALTVSALTTRLIVRPLSEMTRAALKMRQGNYLVELNHRSDDEIGTLAEAFRDMSGEVGKRTVELRTANVHLQSEINERKLAEEEILRLNTRLEERVKERTVELLMTNEHLKQMISAQKEAEQELRLSRQELRNLTAHLHSIREEERTLLSREIHDELGQSLTALKMDASWLGKKLRKDQTALIEKTRAMTSLTETIIKTVQRISTELRPGMLDDLGLSEAIEWEIKEFQNRTGIACDFTGDHAVLAVDRKLSTTVFRIFQESLTNIARHAEASSASVRLEEIEGVLALQVSDNGKGISDEDISDTNSIGLIGMRERARLCCGEVKISALPGGGTVVTLTIPINSKGGQDAEDTHRG